MPPVPAHSAGDALARLLEAGRSADSPGALTESGTTVIPLSCDRLAAIRSSIARRTAARAFGVVRIGEQPSANQRNMHGAEIPGARHGLGEAAHRSVPRPADAAGGRRPQNLPGTTTQYPNWQVPLADGDGRPVLLEDLAGHPGVLGVARAVSAGLATRIGN